MDKVNFTFKRGGYTRAVTERQSVLLTRMGLGEIANRSMEGKPQVTKQAAPVQSQDPGDGLDALSREELHALAKERGVKVHHAAGAAKVIEALREAAS